jgi:amidase
LLLICFSSCSDTAQKGESIGNQTLWKSYDETEELKANAEHPILRMRFKRIQSKILDRNALFLPLYAEALVLDSTTYKRLLPLILEQPIPVLQDHIRAGDFSYEELTRFYLYRIYRYELNRATNLNTIVALNAHAIEAAKNCDLILKALPHEKRHPIFGMPILLKDNIGTAGMPTTAGAAALREHRSDDAFIVRRLKQQGAIVLGKVNLSEWAYYFCEGCPVGYSAIGGQTLNPYGRGRFETGGSSSGSGTGAAAGYAVATVGTETSGSILSPSGQNNIVGLKPTIGLLSRSGIVPISSTLDTPGPMARNVIDAAILLDAMKGNDAEDPLAGKYYLEGTGFVPRNYSFTDKTFGVFENLLVQDSCYAAAVELLQKAGARIIRVNPKQPDLSTFSTLLNADMKRDLSEYLMRYVKDTTAVRIKSALDVLEFNRQDTALYAPYGQARMQGVASDTTLSTVLEDVKLKLLQQGRQFFQTDAKQGKIDAFLSVNNRHAGVAAVAGYPALAVPMGFRKSGEPVGLTFIGKPFQEELLLDMGHAFELLHPIRQMPTDFKD